MTRIASIAASSLVALSLTGSLRAAAITDGFNYTPGGTLSGQVAPGGNAWATAGAATPIITTTATGLASPAGFPAASGGAIQFGNNGSVNQGASSRLGIGSITSGSVYWSLLFRVDDLTGAITGTAGAYLAGFNTNAGEQATNIQTAVSRLVINAGTNDDVADLWIDPALGGSLPTPTLSSTGADVATGTINSFFFRQNGTAPALVTADELRVDTTWAGVTSNSVPEPMIASLLLLAAAGRRRRVR